MIRTLQSSRYHGCGTFHSRATLELKRPRRQSASSNGRVLLWCLGKNRLIKQKIECNIDAKVATKKC